MLENSWNITKTIKFNLCVHEITLIITKTNSVTCHFQKQFREKPFTFGLQWLQLQHFYLLYFLKLDSDSRWIKKIVFSTKKTCLNSNLKPCRVFGFTKILHIFELHWYFWFQVRICSRFESVNKNKNHQNCMIQRTCSVNWFK